MTDEREPETLDETYQRLSPYSGSPRAAPVPPAPPKPPRVYGDTAPAPSGPPSSYAPPPPGTPSVLPPAPLPSAIPAQEAFEPVTSAPNGLRTGVIIAIAGALVAVLVSTIAVVAVAGDQSSVAVADPNIDPDPNVEPDPNVDPDPGVTPVPPPINPGVVDQWTTYPGSAFEDSAAVLAGPSQEKVVADSEALITEFTSTLTADLGVEWEQTWTGILDTGSNGYGGDSMLYDYYSPEWIGSVKLDDPTARQQVYDLLTRLSDDAGGEPLLFSNEVYEDDTVSSKEQFGAATISDQAMWSFYGRDAITSGLSISSRVYDLNLATDPTFTGDSWFTNATEPGVLYVKIQLSAYGLLAEGDRAEFERLLGPYDEDAKPEPR